MSDAVLSALFEQLTSCLPMEQASLRHRLKGIQKMTPEKRGAVLPIVQEAMLQAVSKAAARRDGVPPVTYPDLPVSDRRDEIIKAIQQHQVVIIAGETGSGKTTQLPKMCLEAGRGRTGFIGHTQPRRLAARSVASRIAQEMQCQVGEHVGYKVRFHDQVNDNTYIKLMTDGILLAEIQHDRFLSQYDTLIIDEAHERSLNIDFILGYLKQLLPKRPDLKLIITSATIDPQRFSRHFGNAPVIEVSGRTFPVEVRYRPLEEQDSDEPLDALFAAVDELCAESLGDILVFMNGEREIRDTADALRRRNLRDTEVLPLYSRLSNAEQNRIFSPHAGRRIVLATNVAETSLTVPGIRYVIDPGTARISRYSYRTKVQRLPIEPVSQASANQRKGRCGRVAAGICIRLYSETDFLSRPEFTDPEILRTNLASVILQMLALGLGDISRFPFVEPPDSRFVKDGVRLLEELGAVQTNSQGTQALALTPLGRQLSRIPLDPRLARIVIAAPQFGCLEEILVITAALSIQDPRERPMDKQQAADQAHQRFEDKESDFLSFLNVWRYFHEQQNILTQNQLRKQCSKEFLSYLRLREWEDIHYQVRLATRELGLTLNQEPASFQPVHSALLTGFLSHIGMKDIEKQEFSGARNARFMLFPGSALFKKPPKWVMVSELTETSRLYGRIAAKIQPEWIEPLAQHLLKHHYSDPHWSKKAGAVLASEKVTLFGIPIIQDREVQYGTIDPVVSRELFIRRALVEGDFETRHVFFRDNRRLLEEVEELEAKSRRRDILVDDEALFQFYDARLPAHIVSARHFDKWWRNQSKAEPELLNFEREMLLKGDTAHISELDYPNIWLQGRLKFKLSYQFEPGEEADGVTVSIPLPLLNQVDEAGFDWLIPGLRQELLVALIKSLPKQMRKNFVPAPNYADALMQSISPEQGPLLDAMERQLKRMTGVTVPRDDWNLAMLPDHLKMTFKVVDERGRALQAGKDLATLKEQLKDQVQQALSNVADDDLEQGGLTLWSFGALPQQYSQKQHGFEVKAYPALVDQGDSVAIQLFDTPQAQQQAMQQGQRRLILLNVPSPIKYLQEKLPNKAKLGLYFTPFGKIGELIDDCIACGCDSLIQRYGGLCWDETAFTQQKETIRGELNDTVVTIAATVEQILTTAYGIRKHLKGKATLELAFAYADIQSQLERLIHRGFVTEAGADKLPDLVRYMRGIERRMEKISVDPNRDRAFMLKIQQVEESFQQLKDKCKRLPALPEDVKSVRWMLEELRISYFAQVLGTPYPISDKRVQQAIDAIRL